MPTSTMSIFAYFYSQENDTPNKNQFKVCNPLEVMQNQEKTTYSCSDYLNETTPSGKMIDQTCRDKMTNWCFELVDFLQLSQRTVFMAMSYLDRYLSSGSKVAVNSIHNREEYQLATMTSLYLAIKLHEPIKLNIPTYIHVCNDTRSPDQYTTMENNILNVLNWRLNGPTTFCFLEHFFDSIPSTIFSNSTLSTGHSGLETLLTLSKLYAKLTLNDYYFALVKPSVTALCCISIAMQRIPPCLFNKSDQEAFFSVLSSQINIDLNCLDVREGTKQLENLVMRLPENESELSLLPTQQSMKDTKVDSSSSIKSTNVLQNSSPVCVSRDER